MSKAGCLFASIVLVAGVVTTAACSPRGGDVAGHAAVAAGESEVTPIQADPDGVKRFWTADAVKAVEKLETGSSFPFPPSGGFYCPGVGTCPPGDSHPGDLFGYLPAPSPYATNPVTRVVGMLVYLDDKNVPHHCSASVLASQSRDLLVTAAHCVMTQYPEGPQEVFTKVVFVPAYDGALDETRRAPFGKWAVKRSYASTRPARLADVAVLRLYPNMDEAGQPVHIEDAVGGALRARTSVVGDPLPDLQVYGYPGNDCNMRAGVDCESPDVPPIHRAGRQSVCPTAARVTTVGVVVDHCMVQFGNSGGPLVVVHAGPSAVPGDVLGVVSSIAQAHLDRSVICPLMHAADADADVVDPDGPCDPQYVK